MSNYEQFKSQVPYPKREDFKSRRIIIGEDLPVTVSESDFPQFIKDNVDVLGPIPAAKLMSVHKLESFKGKDNIEIIVQVTFDEEGYQAALRKYRESDYEGRDRFKAYLEEEYGVKGYAKADNVFSYAWEHGHSSGFADVECIYGDLVDILVL